MLTVIEKVLFLQNVEIFKEIPSEYLAHMAAIAEELSVDENEILYNALDPSDALYLVLEGEISLHLDDREITLAKNKEAFGTWALFDEDPRVVTATAMTATRLLRIDREEFIDLLADHIQITQAILKTMVHRLKSLANRVGIDVKGKPSNRS